MFVGMGGGEDVKVGKKDETFCGICSIDDV